MRGACLMGIVILALAGLSYVALAQNIDPATQANAAKNSKEQLRNFVKQNIRPITPEARLAADLIPQWLRLYGVDMPQGEGERFRQLSTISFELYFECLRDIGRQFERDIIFNLGGIDIARIPLHKRGLTPGHVFKQNVELSIPYSISPGKTFLAVGFVRKGAPGQDRTNLTNSMAQLLELQISPAVLAVGKGTAPTDEELARVASTEAKNLLRNGSFELGFTGWEIPENLRNGEDGWRRIMSIVIDNRIAFLDRNSLRVDFGGGQDVNLFSIYQHVSLKPETTYTLSYLIKTQNITSNLGACVAVDGVHASGRFHAAPPEDEHFTGTVAWSPVAVTFTTPPDMTSVAVRIRRFGSGSKQYLPEKYGPIGGSVWYDAVQLVEGESGP